MTWIVLKAPLIPNLPTIVLAVYSDKTTTSMLIKKVSFTDSLNQPVCITCDLSLKVW